MQRERDSNRQVILVAHMGTPTVHSISPQLLYRYPAQSAAQSPACAVGGRPFSVVSMCSRCARVSLQPPQHYACCPVPVIRCRCKC